MYSRPTSPKTIGGVLDDIFKLYAAALPVCWPLALFSGLAMAVPSILLGLRFAVATNPTPQQLLAQFQSPGLWLSYAGIFALSILFSIAILVQIVSLANGEPESTGSAFFRSLRLFPRALVAAFLYILAVMLGTILLVIPGIILMVSLFLSGPLIVAEDASATGSLSRSRQLIKGDWWRTLGVLTIAMIVMYILMICVGIVSGIVAAIGRVDPTTVLVVQNAVNAVLNIFIMPLYSAAAVSIYFDLKLRKEGDDLAERASALAKP